MAEPEYLAEHRASLLAWHREHGSVPGHSWDRVIDERDRHAGLVPEPPRNRGRPRKARPDGGGHHA